MGFGEIGGGGVRWRESAWEGRKGVGWESVNRSREVCEFDLRDRRAEARERAREERREIASERREGARTLQSKWRKFGRA